MATLFGFALACFVSWALCIRAYFQSPKTEDKNPRAAVASAVPPPEEPAPTKEIAKPQRRLVRDMEVKRNLPEAEGVIVAEVESGGKVRLSAPPPQTGMPTGSLNRLQSIHRGKRGIGGSRILDHAKSPLLRELANRVRPPYRNTDILNREPEAAKPADNPEANKTPRPSFKQGTVTGWKKVTD